MIATRCPRCGAAFHCGAHDPVPCACTNVRLSPEQLGALRRSFSGCLCTGCLRELASGSRPMELDQCRGGAASTYSA